MPFSPNDPWLVAFLKRVSTRPGMFLGDESVRTLATFIQGYSQARTDLGLPDFVDGESTLLTDFEKWLAAKLGDTRDVAWFTLVATEDPSERNVRTFFRLLEEFLSEHGKSLSSDATWPP